MGVEGVVASEYVETASFRIYSLHTFLIYLLKNSFLLVAWGHVSVFGVDMLSVQIRLDPLSQGIVPLPL